MRSYIFSYLHEFVFSHHHHHRNYNFSSSAYSILFLQLKHAIPFSAILGFGNIDMTFDVDFSRSPSNTAEFELEVKQEHGTAENGTRMQFDVEFEARL